jgi:hypothetical protein
MLAHRSGSASVKMKRRLKARGLSASRNPFMRSRPMNQPVGWVERSDTHQFPFAKMMGFAKGSTRPGCHRNFDGQRHGRFYKLRDDGMVPLICPTCQNVFAGKASMPATPLLLCMGLFSIF